MVGSTVTAARGGGILIASGISTVGCWDMMVGLAISAEVVSPPLRVFLLARGGVFATVCLFTCREGKFQGHFRLAAYSLERFKIGKD